MIKLLAARYLGKVQVDLMFLDGKEGVFSGHELLQRQGPLLEALRDEAFFQRFFIDAGALCWPNELELSSSRLYEACQFLAVVNFRAHVKYGV